LPALILGALLAGAVTLKSANIGVLGWRVLAVRRFNLVRF